MNQNDQIKDSSELAREIVADLEPSQYPAFFRTPLEKRLAAIRTMIEVDRIGEVVNIAGIARRCGNTHSLRMDLYRIADQLGVARSKKRPRITSKTMDEFMVDEHPAPVLARNYVVVANPSGVN